MDNRGKEVATGNAAKIAADFTKLTLVDGIAPETLLELFQHYLDEVSARIIVASESNAPETVPDFAQPGFQPQAALQNAFPGSQVVEQAPQVVAPPSAPAPAPQAQVVQFPQQGAVPSGPAPIPNASTGGSDPVVEENWTVFFNDVASGKFADNWHDNRGNKRNEKSPDFRHKTWKRPGDKYPVGVWVGDKKAPAWVAQKLAELGINA